MRRVTLRIGLVLVTLMIAGLGGAWAVGQQGGAPQSPAPAPAQVPARRAPVYPSSQMAPGLQALAPRPGDGPPRPFVYKGSTYRAIQTDERGESEQEELREHAPAPPGAAGLAGPRPTDGEHFAGSARKAAKTSFAAAPIENFASVGDLLDSILGGSDPGSNDADLRNTIRSSTPRTAPEARNVSVTAFLYATKKESDNDFHLLIGDTPDGSGRFLTSEVSGLPFPDDAQAPAFQAVRDQYRAFFAAAGMALPGDRYVKFDPPVPVTVTGSLFFDVDHTIGQVRSGNVAPQTVWEIHPISDLSVAPGGG